ncbi:MAG: nucleotidyl transferase AbiEii/AbiGii toxin family protein [Acidobacteria bacterium]|nr:nucleotidyl transferase AbiEii/AbiGii toxin family protein [Acidobacteriota bacterium]
MNALLRAAADLQAVCVTHHWRFCFIGGIAVMRWGEPRETIDVDLTLITGFGREREFVTVLMKAFRPRIDEAAAFAERNRVLLLRADSGVGLDIALGGLPFEELAVERSTPFAYPPDIPLRTCSAEDLIVLKAFAGRPKDWVDIEGVIIRQSHQLDWPYVQAQLAPLVELKDAPELLEQLERTRARLES